MQPFQGSSSRQADSTGAKNALRTIHVDDIFFTRLVAETARAGAAEGGGVACGSRRGSADRPLAGDQFCTPARGAVDADSDSAQGRAGRSYGRRRGLRLGPEIPARLWQAPTALRLDRRPLVHGLSGRRLGYLRAGDDDTRLRTRDLVADRVAGGRPAARLLRRGDARALSDLQLQGLQVQSGPAAARHAAARGAGLSQRVRKAQLARGPLA